MLMDALIVGIPGVLVGAVFSKRIMQGPGFGLIGNIIIGVIGALFVRFVLWPQDIKVGDSYIGSSISAFIGFVLRTFGLSVTEEFITLIVAGFFGASLLLFLIGRVKR